MRRARALGIIVVAALATSATATASASAQAPEFGRCIKKPAVEKIFSGKYSDAKCTIAVTPEEEATNGRFEWFPGAVAGKNAFTISGGALVWETINAKTLTCKSEKGKGEYSLTDSKRVTGVVLEMAGCKSAGLPCTTIGKASGELEFNELVGEAGYENLSKRKTALKLEPGPTAGGYFIQFACVGLGVRIRAKGGEAGAGILVNIRNDRMTATDTLKYTFSTKRVQKPVRWEGSPEETYIEMSFEKLPFEQAGWSGESTITNDEEMKYELNLLV
jgi:hypothetical protein